MMALARQPTLWLVLATLSWSCSQYSTKPLPVAYHNLNARYNAYVIARDRLRITERYIQKSYVEDYNHLLPILLPLDSTRLEPVRAQLDDAIKKASLVAERHQNSKWLDDSYVILGKARLYRQDYTNAMEVFKYVNTKGTGENEKHEALIWLMRTYLELGDYTNALNAAEFIRTQPLNKANTRDYYLTKSYLHQRRQEYAMAAALLDATFPLLKKEKSTARLHLIAGQLYDLLKKTDQAQAHYRQVLRNRPSYEQSFYATMYSILGSQASSERFSRMLNDRKNTDLKDKIYYTMGLLEARNGNYANAINQWQQSIRETTINTTQIPHTYQEIAKIYFEHLKDYPLAKAYYDSSLTLLPPQSAEYNTLISRKKILDEVVEHQQTIQLEDSLQRLTKLNPAILDRQLDKLIDDRYQQKQKRVAQAQTIANRAANQPMATSDLPPNERWYFYNPVLLNQGRQAFTQRWGNRPLEDNWRRSSKELTQSSISDVRTIPDTALTVPSLFTQTASALTATERKAQKDALYAAIPFTPEAFQKSNQRLEDAYYRLGKLYKLQLGQPDKAILNFEALLNQFPMTAAKPEVYYLLFLSSEQLKRPSPWKDKLLAEFPGSSYARLVGSLALNEGRSSDREALAQRTYTEVYELYKTDHFTEALIRAESALASVSGSQIEDKMALLRVMLIGKTTGLEPYRQALNEFVRDYPSSPLLLKVKEMLLAADQPTPIHK